MVTRSSLLTLSMFLLLLALGCTGQGEVPTVASLPTVTPVLPTETPTGLPATWTPSPTAAVACDLLFTHTAQSAQPACRNMATGEACFVADRAGLALRPVTGVPSFATPGDRVLLTLFNRIDTAAYDPANNTWGMALLEITGATPEQAVTLLPFGQTTIIDADNGTGAFQSMYIITDPNPPQCSRAPLPGVLLQSHGSEPAEIRINAATVKFTDTLLVRGQAQDTMHITVLNGSAQISTEDGGQDAPAGTTVHSPLGGPTSFDVIGPFSMAPLNTTQTTHLPLAALPRAVAVSPPALATSDSPGGGDIISLPPTRTPEPTETPLVPYSGTPPNGMYMTYGGKRIVPNGAIINSIVPEGGSDVWVFEPVGLPPEMYDSFEIITFGDWNPVLTIESATWGPYIVDYDQRSDNRERFLGSLAGSGGDWRIVIRDAYGGGGAYTISYDCRGSC